MLFAYESQLLTVADSRSMAADFTSSTHDLVGWECGSVVAKWTGASATTARVVLEVSDDGDCWCNYIAEADSVRVDSASGCGIYEIQRFCFAYLRVKFLKKTETTGTITIKSFVKRPRIA